MTMAMVVRFLSDPVSSDHCEILPVNHYYSLAPVVETRGLANSDYSDDHSNNILNIRLLRLNHILLL